MDPEIVGIGLSALIVVTGLLAYVYRAGVKVQRLEGKVAELEKDVSGHLSDAADVRERLVRLETKVDILLKHNGVKHDG